jgi:hypothetical protein
MSGTNSSSGGIGLGGILFVVFLTLKLTGFIDWSWWWITAPLWAPFLVAGILFIVFVAGVLVFKAMNELWRTSKGKR